MNIYINIGIITAVIGSIGIIISIWMIITDRDKKYNEILSKHLDQKTRVQEKINNRNGH